MDLLSNAKLQIKRHTEWRVCSQTLHQRHVCSKLHGWYMCSQNCNTPQHTATHCNTPQHTATHCNTANYMGAIRVAKSEKCMCVKSVCVWKVYECEKCMCVKSVCVWKVYVCEKCMWQTTCVATKVCVAIYMCWYMCSQKSTCSRICSFKSISIRNDMCVAESYKDDMCVAKSYMNDVCSQKSNCYQTTVSSRSRKLHEGHVWSKLNEFSVFTSTQ